MIKELLRQITRSRPQEKSAASPAKISDETARRHPVSPHLAAVSGGSIDTSGLRRPPEWAGTVYKKIPCKATQEYIRDVAYELQTFPKNHVGQLSSKEIMAYKLCTKNANTYDIFHDPDIKQSTICFSDSNKSVRFARMPNDQEVDLKQEDHVPLHVFIDALALRKADCLPAFEAYAARQKRGNVSITAARID